MKQVSGISVPTNATFFGKISHLKFGKTIDAGNNNLPEYISWISLLNDNTEITVWLCDDSLKSQYPHYEITVVPPISNLDLFFESYTTVNAIKTVTPSMIMDNIQNAKGVDPETYIRSFNFEYISPIASNVPVDTTWSVLIYGLQGDNPDSIKDAMIEYILNNSTHTRSEWESIIPDLFKRTEFIILPRWDKYAVPNNTIQAGLYSSIQDPLECVEFAKKQCSFYDESYVNTSTCIVPHTYKTVSLVIVKGPNNIEGKQSFYELFEDYLPINSGKLIPVFIDEVLPGDTTRMSVNYFARLC